MASKEYSVFYQTAVDTETKTAALSMASGDQVINRSADKYMTQVTITKPDTLIPANIKKDIIIGGVTGTYEGDIAGNIELQHATSTNVSQYATATVKLGSAAIGSQSSTSDPTMSFNAETGVVTATINSSIGVSGTCTEGWVDSITSGTLTVSGTNSYALQTQAGQTITPSTANQVISNGKYLLGDQIILGDANLIASNIRQGVSIFGVAGTCVAPSTHYFDTLSSDQTLTWEEQNSDNEGCHTYISDYYGVCQIITHSTLSRTTHEVTYNSSSNLFHIGVQNCDKIIIAINKQKLYYTGGYKINSDADYGIKEVKVSFFDNETPFDCFNTNNKTRHDLFDNTTGPTADNSIHTVGYGHGLISTFYANHYSFSGTYLKIEIIN